MASPSKTGRHGGPNRRRLREVVVRLKLNRNLHVLEEQ
ncbi:hypothetical protein A2U01_0102700 [Trifolium medium]|uniref:Uncharacterized protein n=1 Tax=Trifolium medium TaxID=97028 RepID=A0A392UZX6_9FABA|nr:hypothetical protein [Trifolium medium]